MKGLTKRIAKLLIFTMSLTLLSFNLGENVKAATVDQNNGDWSSQYVTKRYPQTNEAELMVRVGDIDNMGYGFGSIDPFSGAETAVHGYPFRPAANDHAGTDRVMVVSGYTAQNSSVDGYAGATYNKTYTVSGKTYNYDTKVAPIKLTYDLTNIAVKDAQIQMFVDDIQPKKFKLINGKWVNSGRGGFSTSSYNEYEVTCWVEGKQAQAVRVTAFEEVINNLDQHGPIGKLITLNFPTEYLELIRQGETGFYIKIDDADLTTKNTSGQTINATGDGFAIDFVKLLVNRNTGNTQYNGTVKGKVYEAKYVNNQLVLDYTKPVNGAEIKFSGVDQAVTSDASGNYLCSTIPAGQVIVSAKKDGYAEASYAIGTLLAKQVLEYNIGLIKTDVPMKPTITLDNYMPTNEAVTVTIDYPGDVQYRKYRINGGAWQDYDASFKVNDNCLVEAQSTREIKTSATTTSKYYSAIAEYRVTNIDKTIPPRPVLTPDTTRPVNRNITVSITYPAGQVVKEAHIRIGDGSWSKYLEGSIPSSAVVTDNTTVYAKYKNQYGNWSEIGSCVVNNIDRTPPSAVLSYRTSSGSSYNPANWTNQDVIAMLTNFDSPNTSVTVENGSISNLNVNTSGALTAAYTFTVSDGNVATPAITFVLTDEAGNTTRINASAKIDKKAPQALIRLKSADDQPYDSNNWTNQDVVVEIYNFDDQNASVSSSGVDSNRFTVNNTSSGKVVSYTINVAPNTEETPVITFILTDEAGNSSSLTARAKIDKIRPTATITYIENADKTKTATAVPSEDYVTFTSAGGDVHLFERTGTFRFEFVDKAGNTGYADAEGRLITTGNPNDSKWER